MGSVIAAFVEAVDSIQGLTELSCSLFFEQNYPN